MSTVLLAGMAGVLTIGAPCILPMLPILLGGAVGQTSRARPAFIALGFVCAFCACALGFGLFSDALGVGQERLRGAAIAMLLVFGVLMLWKRPFALLTMRMSGLLTRATAIGDGAGAGKLGGFVLGMTLGVVWTPCAGPVLGTILTLVATAHDLGRASLLLLCYAIGAGIPMLLIAYGGQFATTRVRGIARYASGMQRVFGMLIVLTALAMHFQYDATIALWLSALYPGEGA